MTVGRNVAHGFIGFVAPAIVVVLSYPVLIRHLGPSAFGVYLLASSLGGTVMLFDLGFSAATLRFVAQDLAAGRAKAAADVVATSLVFYGLMGLIGGAIIAAFAPAWAMLFKVDSRLVAEATAVFRLAGLQFAAYLPAMVFVSIAKAVGQFDRSAMFVSLISIATCGSAMVAVMAGQGLIGAMAAAVIAGIAAFALIVLDGLRLCRAQGMRMSAASPVAFRRMFSFGWVLTVNSVSGFLLYQVQKFLVGATMGPTAVAVYQTASIVPSKLHAAVNASTEVMFPLSSAAHDRGLLRRVYLRMLGGSALAALAGSVALVALARPVLAWWLGAPLANSVSPLVPIFALGYFFLALSPAPFHLVNGMGKPGLNTLFYGINAFLNVMLIAAFAWRGLTLGKFAWAFAVANIVTSILYQAVVEMFIWRQEPRIMEARA